MLLDGLRTLRDTVMLQPDPETKKIPRAREDCRDKFLVQSVVESDCVHEHWSSQDLVGLGTLRCCGAAVLQVARRTSVFVRAQLTAQRATAVEAHSAGENCFHKAKVRPQGRRSGRWRWI